MASTLPLQETSEETGETGDTWETGEKGDTDTDTDSDSGSCTPLACLPSQPTLGRPRKKCVLEIFTFSLGSRPMKAFLGKSFPKFGWVWWRIPKKVQTSTNHQKSPRKSPFKPEFHPLFSQISQKPWGGWVRTFGKTLPPIFFWYGSS